MPKLTVLQGRVNGIEDPREMFINFPELCGSLFREQFTKKIQEQENLGKV